MSILVTTVFNALTEKANSSNAKSMKAYMLNQFDFFGVKTPERRAISNAIFKQYKIESIAVLEAIVKELWAFKEREMHYIAIECLAYHKKLWQASTIQLIEELIITKSWWDCVDAVASFVLTTYFKNFPHLMEPTTQKWNNTDNIWLQRSSIMFQKAFKQKTNTVLLEKYIINLAASKEFFIQKAIGWALREYGKTNPNWVKDFVNKHEAILSTLSKKEAIRRL